jgi:hypothetical protein
VRGPENLDIAFDIVGDVDVQLAVELVVVFVLDQVVKGRVLEVARGRADDGGGQDVGRAAVGSAADVRQ